MARCRVAIGREGTRGVKVGMIMEVKRVGTLAEILLPGETKSRRVKRVPVALRYWSSEIVRFTISIPDICTEYTNTALLLVATYGR